MSTSERIRYPAAPLENVWLENGFDVSDDAWGKTVHYVDLPGLSASLLRVVVLKLGRLSGSEVAYLRRKLDLSQAECARVMGVEEQTLSLWERGKYWIPTSTDALFRRICVEELRKAFPRNTQFPKTSVLVQRAYPIRQGVYVGTYKDGLWDFSNEMVQAEQVTVSPITAAVIHDWQLPQDWARDVTISSAVTGLGRLIRVSEPEDVNEPHAMEISNGRDSFLFTYASRTAARGVRRVEARSPEIELYEVNPVTGAMFKSVTSRKSKESLHEN